MHATTISHTISEAALERIRDLGFGVILAEMLEHIGHSLKGLIRIEVNADQYEPVHHRIIFLDVIVESASVEEQKEMGEAWRAWAYETFRPELAMHFLVTFRPEKDSEV